MSKKQQNFTNKIKQDLTMRVIAMMENAELMGTPWTMETFGVKSGLHFNAKTNHVFQGANQLICLLSGFSDARWFTKKDIFSKENDLKLKKGSKCTYLLKPVPAKSTVETEKDGETKKEVKQWTNFIPIPYWNAEQLENPPVIEMPEIKEFSVINNAENFKSKMLKNGQDLRYTDVARYFYSPKGDFISMLRPELFGDNVSFYSTYLHETAHWSGHETRLNRNLTSIQKSDYAFEELIAELFATFQCSILGLEKTPRADHAKYLKSWIKCLKDNYNLLWKASSQAFEIVRYCDNLK